MGGQLRSFSDKNLSGACGVRANMLLQQWRQTVGHNPAVPEPLVSWCFCLHVTNCSEHTINLEQVFGLRPTVLAFSPQSCPFNSTAVSCWGWRASQSSPFNLESPLISCFILILSWDNAKTDKKIHVVSTFLNWETHKSIQCWYFRI